LENTRKKIIKIINNVRIVKKNKKIYPIYLLKSKNLTPIERRVLHLINLMLFNLDLVDLENRENEKFDIYKMNDIKKSIKKNIIFIVNKIMNEID
jgi:hypothetical protein